MCVDIFAVGHAITIQFLHEQLWFEVGYRTISSDLVVDAFIKNDGDEPIDQIRLQLPHFAPFDQVEVLSTPSVVINDGHLHTHQYNWIGKFALNYEKGRVKLTLDLNYEDNDDADSDLQLDEAVPLSGAFDPNGFLPLSATDTARSQGILKRLDRAVMVLVLKEPLRGKDTGWLRLRLPTVAWPKSDTIVDLTDAWFSGEATRFVARALVLSPEHLRRDLLEQLEKRENKALHNEVVKHGWEKWGTLTRVEEHRVSVVVPSSVDFSHVSCTPRRVFWGGGPAPLPTDRNRCVLHFVAGSRFNGQRDIVILARRICDYCHYLTADGSRAEHAPGIELLVTRFGATSHEAVGELIDQMLECRLLRRVGDRPDAVTAAPRSELPKLLLELRRRYTLPQRDRQFSKAFQELHSFRIAFTLCWTALSEDQQRASVVLANLMRALVRGEVQSPQPRLAVLVSSVECRPTKLGPVPQIDKIAAQLARHLDEVAHIDVRRLRNPSARKPVTDSIREKLESIRGGGLFVLWYIGHAFPSTNGERLVLGATMHETLEWQELVDLFEEFASVSKVVVLDCCHAALGLTQAAQLDNCLIWATTDANHGAQAGGIVDELGEHSNFTARFTEQLSDVARNERVTFFEVLEEAQKYAIGNFEANPRRTYGTKTEPLLVDPEIRRRNDVHRLIEGLRRELGPNRV
jgi:hypothetical protein